MTADITSKENIALNLISEWMEESFINRTWAEYVSIANRIPKLEALHSYINQRLSEIAASGTAPYSICYFRKADRYPWYEPFPTSLSKATIRSALKKAGFSQLRKDPNLDSYFGKALA